MKLVVQVTLTLLFATVATVHCDSVDEDKYDSLKSERARQKIYDIISSHEDRKYGDHGGHEYEEGEIPKKSASQKYKRYGYEPDDKNYYYVQPKQPKAAYLPRAPVSEKVYLVPNSEPAYAHSKGSYPVVETSYIEPKKRYLINDKPYDVAKRPESLYVAPIPPKDHIYHETVGSYLEDKTAPITIGKTARTVYPSSLSNTPYSVVNSKHPSEYLVLEGQKPPRPLILDPKLKAKYQYSQPVAHYSAPEHQIVLKPEVSIPVHYPAPVKDYEHYDNHHNAEEKGHHESGHGYYDDNLIKKESGHKSHGHHDINGHKSHSSVASHHDDHGQHHNRGLYERDRGYHYEKAYAYDRVRAHHDIGSTHGGHSSYNTQHGHEGHKDAGNHDAETYSYFKKNDHGSGYGYQDGNSLYKKNRGYFDRKYIPTYYHG